LEEPNLGFRFMEHMDVLEWWKNNSLRFSEISIMARDLLSIPITTVASKSFFSIGSRILNRVDSYPRMSNPIFAFLVGSMVLLRVII